MESSSVDPEFRASGDGHIHDVFDLLVLVFFVLFLLGFLFILQPLFLLYPLHGQVFQHELLSESFIEIERVRPGVVIQVDPKVLMIPQEFDALIRRLCLPNAVLSASSRLQEERRLDLPLALFHQHPAVEPLPRPLILVPQ